MKYLWKIGGEAGFGIMTTGLMFTTLAARSGYHVFDYTEYPSLIRGGHNTTDVVFSDEPVYANKHGVDMLVCLNADTFRNHKHRLHDDSIVIYDDNDLQPEGRGKFLMIPFRRFKREQKVMQTMVNMIAMGASLALLDADMSKFQQLLEEQFARKGQDIVDFNRKLADLGYNYVKEHYAEYVRPVLQPREGEAKLILTGNDAFSLATTAADCRFYAAYPMTPSSTVLSTLAGWEKRTGMVVRHAEDEISVITTALGASAMGVRSAVGTSGGGFALMVENISYAGVAEVPIVIFLGQRPGPATGIPTWTEQGDLLFAVHAGHGEFPKIVLAPGDIEEMIEIGMEAFNLADIYQTPVIVMSDKLLSESHWSDSKEKLMTILKTFPIDRGKLVRETRQEPYLRYKITDDGISERLIPGQKGKFYQSNSYEHTEDSHTTEHAAPRIAQVNKRARKTITYLNMHFKPPTVLGNFEAAEFVFVSWGGNKGIIREAMRILDHDGVHTAFIHFHHVFPLKADTFQWMFEKGKHMVLVENNSHAQFGRLLRQETGIYIEDQLLRYDGSPHTPEDIAAYIRSKKL
ncbi:MAG: 2-oxoacid:acceptor oxidoreductase subunit alpha [Patescibacteria group bacterium]|nr:2-oxoacid:acceptor oxidoreductase subunit alpha [Patescibacteria group bacterium]